jgi:hypothetical protein
MSVNITPEEYAAEQAQKDERNAFFHSLFNDDDLENIAEKLGAEASTGRPQAHSEKNEDGEYVVVHESFAQIANRRRKEIEKERTDRIEAARAAQKARQSQKY